MKKLTKILTGILTIIALPTLVWATISIVPQGGTGQGTFGQGWIYSLGGVTPLNSSTSPTVNYLTATSTTEPSTFAGSVGIGTSSPMSLLTIAGVSPAFSIADTSGTKEIFQLINTSGRLNITSNKRGTTEMQFYNNGIGAGKAGEVRIGTSSNIVANGSKLFIFGGQSGANVDSMGDSSIVGGDQATFEAEGSDYGVNGTQSSLAIRYFGPGGLGTTAGFPNQRLGVLDFGNASTSIIQTQTNQLGQVNPLIFVTDSTEKMRLSGVGNLGVGVINPTQKVDVAGFVNVDQYSGYKQAGNTILTASSTNHSTNVGIIAGRNLNASGIRNISIGEGALSSATSSANNIAIGYYALANTVDCINSGGTQGGNSNVALGYLALNSNTCGLINFGLGFQALFRNTTGTTNIGIGGNALYNNTTGSYNVAIGDQALGKSTLTTVYNYNTAIAPFALNNHQSGSGNVAIGYSTQSGDIDGTYNTIIGYAALGLGTSTDLGVAIGKFAGSPLNAVFNDYNSAVDQNFVFIGALASRDNNTASTSALTNAIAIGYNSKVGCSNCASIGTNGMSLGVGSSTPYAHLSVSGDGNTTPLFAVATTSNQGLPNYMIDSKGHIITSGQPPVISSCGTTPSFVGPANDTNMIVQVGSVAATACTITFAKAYATRPRVTISNESMSITNAMTFTVSTTAITISQVALTGAILDISVEGTQ